MNLELGGGGVGGDEGLVGDGVYDCTQVKEERVNLDLEGGLVGGGGVEWERSE